MEASSALCSLSILKIPLTPSKWFFSKANCTSISTSSSSSRWCVLCSYSSSLEGASSSSSDAAVSYKKFIQFGIEKTKLHTHLLPSPLQEKFGSLTALDGKTKLEMLSFEAPKIGLLRSLSIEGSGMQVLDFAAFAKPEYDLPIFCANFFSASSTNIVVLDLNPLHDVIGQRNYKEKYYRHLIPLGLKYAELLPWGGMITSESLQFFSPIVIWSKFSPSSDNYDILFSAFKDYYEAWLELMQKAIPDTDISQVARNRAAQHKYLTWRAEKDPGYQLLKRLIGESAAKEVIRDFLFNGVHQLGTKTFLDYFPEYKCVDGSINQKRSMSGKSFETRPWDAGGEFRGDGS